MHANDKIKQNQCPSDLGAHQLAEELHKPIRKFKKRTVYPGFKDYLGCWFSWYAINKQV